MPYSRNSHNSNNKFASLLWKSGFAFFFCAAFASAATPAFGDRFHDLLGQRFQRNATVSRGTNQKSTATLVHRWNQIATDATGLDHTPVAPGEARVFGEQFGPGRASRAMAMVHVAIFDAINSVPAHYRSYTGITAGGTPLVTNAAISQSAHDTLASLYPSQKSTFDTALTQELQRISSSPQKAAGVALGKRIASALLTLRKDDGSAAAEPHLGVDYTTSSLPGHWRQDPISLVPIALGARWGNCSPFVLASGSQFRLPPPPAMTSAEYVTAYDEVKLLGGDGITTPTQRTPEQTFIGTFWAYDGTPSLCAPPRLYNQIVVQLADQAHLNAYELARLLALTNVAMADAAIAGWDSKYHWDFWRPITGIREADPHTGPTGKGDGNPATFGDPPFTPLGAPASNLHGPNFTPPFPSYPSGHACFGGAVFQVLRRYFGTDNVRFTFVSDEFNGVTKANDGTVRPYIPRYFSSLSQAEKENGRSRIYLGIHWNFDATSGITQGRQVGNYVYAHAFTPVN